MPVVSLVLSRFDYGNTTLNGIPAYLLHCLQSVFNAAASIIAGLQRLAHISTMLASLHCLGAAERIQFKLAPLTFPVLQGSALRCLSAGFIRVADVLTRRRLRSSSTNSLIVSATRHRRRSCISGRPDELTSLQSQHSFWRQL